MAIELITVRETRLEQIDETMEWFAVEQKTKLLLERNMIKSPWRNEKIKTLFMLLVGEVEELSAELIEAENLRDGNHETLLLCNMIGESADIANFAMFIADVAAHRIKRLKEEGTVIS